MDRNNQAAARAFIRGNAQFPNVRGIVEFIPQRVGCIVRVQLTGLPRDYKNNYFGFHIHQGNRCTPSGGRNPFSDASSHFNPENDNHPQHAGDLGNLYSNNGLCRMNIQTWRFNVNDVINRTIIVHRMPDDLSSDPSGDSGMRMGCGVITRNRR